MEDLVGTQIGQYKILALLGQGGMSTVFRGLQASLDREVAIKVLPPYFSHDPQFAVRFQREARSVARLRHPNILTVFDFGEQDGYTYIVMEYIEGGRTLTQVLDEQKVLDLQTAALVIQQVASALDYAHQHKIVHRDIKPSNILVPRHDWFLLSDFGIAKVAGGGDLTKTGVGMGTPDYMAPEQGRGLEVDGRADIYSLGVMLYRMVVGQLPFHADTPMGVIIKHINEPLPRPTEQNPNVPEAVEQIILKAMAKEPDERYQTAGELAEDLKQAVDQVRHSVGATVTGLPPAPAKTLPRTPTAAAPTAPAPGRSRWPVLVGGGALLAGAVVVCLILGLGGLAMLNGSPTATPTQLVQAPTATAPLPTAATPATPAAIADFESGVDQWSVNLAGAGSTVERTADTQVIHTGAASLRIAYHLSANGWGGCDWSFTAPQDWSRADGLSLWRRTNAADCRATLTLFAGNPTAPATYIHEFQSSTTWSQLVLPWSALVRADWSAEGPVTVNPAQITGIAFAFPEDPAPRQGMLWIDDIHLETGALPTPAAPPATRTPAPTATPTATPAPTDTVVPTATNTRPPAATSTTGPTSTPKPTSTPEKPALTGQIAFPVLNADGYHYDIWVVNADGANLRRVAEKMRQPSFRPDGVMLAANGEAPNEAHIIIMNADGSNHHAASEHVEDSHPSWSPDGRRLAYDTTAAPGGDSQIAIIKDPNARTWEVIPGPGVSGLRGKYPTWLPDGRIIFNTANYWADNTQGGLYAIGDSGGVPARITSSGQDTAPAAHGGALAFMSIRTPGDYEIFTTSVYGLDAGLKQLTDNNAQDGLPAWSPNGQFIAFMSDEGGRWGLWVMRADGAGRQKIIDLPGTLGGDWGDERVSWAP